MTTLAWVEGRAPASAGSTLLAYSAALYGCQPDDGLVHVALLFPHLCRSIFIYIDLPTASVCYISVRNSRSFTQTQVESRRGTWNWKLLVTKVKNGIR